MGSSINSQYTAFLDESLVCAYYNLRVLIHLNLSVELQ